MKSRFLGGRIFRCPGGCGLAVLMMISPGLHAQPTEKGNSSERIYFSVLDRAEKPVLNLTASDFRLRVQGRLTEFSDFRPGRPVDDKKLPLAAWILLDFNPKIDALSIANQAGAAATILGFLHHDSVLGVKLVSDRMETLAPLTNEADVLAAAFRSYQTRRSSIGTRNATGAVYLGEGGILRAVQTLLEEWEPAIREEPQKEVMRAVMILSDGNVNPSFPRKRLVEPAARAGVFLYPVFIPRRAYGYWLEPYFDLAKSSGGVASVFGAMNPGSSVFNLPRENRDPNALLFNLMTMIRDINGKYSFVIAEFPEENRLRLEITARNPGFSIRLPRKDYP